MGDKKNVLIVYAHPEPKSFNGALKDAAVETLRAQGHDVVVSDLYEMGFDPVASKASFKGKPFFIEIQSLGICEIGMCIPAICTVPSINYL